MPPRRNTRSVAAAERATTALSPLPLSVVLYIFSLLPVDCRLRCAEVCRGWRSVLLERSLWTRLELTAASGVRVREVVTRGVLDGLFRCASRRAGGGLHSLQVDTEHVTHEALMDVLAANAGALRELHTHSDEPYTIFRQGVAATEVEALCVAAPLLRIFATDLYGDPAGMQAVRRALRNEAPFGLLRVVHLNAEFGDVDEAGVVALAADVAAHASVNRLELQFAPLNTPAALDAVVDAALARRMHTVALHACGLSRASAPALARLLGGGALTSLSCAGMRLLDAPAAAVLAAALRANSTLTSLALNSARVFDDPAAAAELLGALHGHVSLRVLSLWSNLVEVADRAAVGAALGSLVAANAPALTQLDVAWCWLGDDGLRALFAALPRNTHLRTLHCSHNGISAAFARTVLLPAVRANVSLRKLEGGHETAHATQAAALVRDRR
jgi:hypothetical protein